ncbi:hypothetical protein [Glaciimonas sp. PAMC28666]|uniref:hypothetical protein n=1 Tax=Glaciimonas sp. PAMC28666 TaxID=2807626 RepID=UPI001963C588|nr:hypothetical protein [Glaciimonas sp. PAMC28666]QRX83307.1 hypothetical protein JQN73_03265 [Glaciimonas sp. PAMC28666]
MKKALRIAALSLVAAASLLWSATPAMARTFVDWSVNVDVPGPAYYPPPPRVYYPPPPPVYYAPRPVYVQPPPVYVETYPSPYYRHPGYYRHGYGWREREWRRGYDR